MTRDDMLSGIHAEGVDEVALQILASEVSMAASKKWKNRLRRDKVTKLAYEYVVPRFPEVSSRVQSFISIEIGFRLVPAEIVRPLPEKKLGAPVPDRQKAIERAIEVANSANPY